MIRRDIVRGEGVAAWLLIRQIEHARLAAQLAKHWRFWPAVSRGVLRDHLLKAVFHHDDGWDEWDHDPTVRSTDGAPLSFLEMPLDTSLAIWTESVREAERLGPLAGNIVAGHFLFLLGKSTVAEDARARRWTDLMESKRDQLLRQWRAESPELHTTAVAAEALQWLQIWDGLSLWFCCAEHETDHAVELPDGTTITFQPAENGRVYVIPWVFHLPEVELEVQAIECPARRYSSVAALIAEHGQPVEFRWMLTEKGRVTP